MNRRTKKLVVLGVVAGALVLAAGGAVTARELIRERRAVAGLAAGKDAFSSGDYEGAMRGIGAYVSRYKDDPEALLMLAKARSKVPMENRRHLPAAANLAKQALDKSPDSKEALALVVDLYSQLGFKTETGLYAERLLKVDPSNRDAHMAITAALAASSNWKEAITAADKMVAACPEDVDAHAMQFYVLSGSGVSPAVIRDRAVALLATHPNSLRFHLLAAGAAVSAKDATTLEQLVGKIIEFPVSSAAELSDVLSLLERVQDSDQRIASYLVGLESDPSLGPVARDLRAEREWKFGRVAVAAAQCRIALQSPDQASSRALMLATLSLSVPEDQAAIDAAFAELAKRTADSDHYWVMVAQGGKAQREGRIAEAREKLADAVQRDPRPGFAQFLLADLIYPLGEQAEAIRLLESIVGFGRGSGDPSWRVARGRLGSMQLDSGRIDDAGALARASLSIKTALPELLTVGYTMLTGYEIGMVQPADLEGLVRVLAAQSDATIQREPNILGLRAWALLTLGNSAEARPLLEQLLKTDAAPFLEISMRLLSLSRGPFPTTHDALLTHFRELAPRELALLGYEASTIAQTQGTAAAKAFIDDAAKSALATERFRYEIALASAIERTDPQAAIKIYEEVVARPDPQLSALLAIVDSQVAWTRKDLVTSAIAGLREPLGSNSARLQTLDARRRLTFERSDKAASEIVATLTKVVEADRRDVYAATMVAEAYVELGNRAAAIDTIDRTLAQTRSPALYPRLISLLQASGRSQDAADRLRQFMSFGRLPDELVRERARLLTLQGMFPEAKEDLLRIGDRRTADDFMLTANVLSRLGDVTGAAAAVDAARAASPHAIGPILAAAELEGRAGRFQKGLDLLAMLPASVDPGEKSAAIAAYTAKFGDPAAGEAALLASAEKGGAPAWGELAQFYFRRGEREKAVEAVDRGLKITPDDSRLNWLKGSIMLAGGDDKLGESMDMLARAAGGPDASPAVKEVVEVFRVLAKNPGKWSDAAKSLREITQKYPTDIDIRGLLVNALMNAGDPQGAASEALKARDAVPADPRGARLAATTLAATGRLNEALVAGRGWKALSSSTDPEPDFFLAQVHGLLAQPKEALDLLTPHLPAVESGADADAQHLLIAANSLARGGQVPAAQQLLRSRLETEAKLVSVCVEASKSMYAAPDSAREWLGELAPSAAKQPQLAFMHATAMYQFALSTGTPADFTAAAVAAEKAAADPGFEAAAKRIAASARMQSGDPAAAIVLYRQVMAKVPDDPATLNNLAMLLMQSGNAPEAASLAKKAVEASIKQGDPPAARASFLDTLGLCLAANGAVTEAEQAFNESTKLSPEYPDPLIGLIELYTKANRIEDARKSLRRVDAIPNLKTGIGPETARRLEAARAAVAKN